MARDEPYDPRYGGHRRREANHRFPVIRARRCSPAERNDREHDEVLDVRVGLRVIACFSEDSPTLTSEDIAGQLDLSLRDVNRAATWLACLGYLTLDPESPEDA